MSDCAVADPICRPFHRPSQGAGQHRFMLRHMRYRMRHRAPPIASPSADHDGGRRPGARPCTANNRIRGGRDIANWRCGCSSFVVPDRVSALSQSDAPSPRLTPACAVPPQTRRWTIRESRALSPIASWRSGQGNWPSGSRQDPAPAGPLRGLCLQPDRRRLRPCAVDGVAAPEGAQGSQA